ncbi:hypothetical protein V5799_033400 [Amblyomma americanum]|uniref:Fibronectin type-III domain-containing protein n=1 Tax=Amblyomma americanum TaxID=6943 RepID=A0AAQ4DNF1_AMBAM
MSGEIVKLLLIVFFASKGVVHGVWQDTLTVSGLETKATVRGLLPTTAYQLRVRADNVLGISDYSGSVEFTTSKERYSLYYKTEGSASNEWHEVSVPHDRRAFTLTDLRCGTEYLLYIRAANRAGKGPEGETLSVRTNGGRPLEPEPSRLFEINSTFVVLHLDAWESGGCPVSYFVVQYRPEARPSSPASSSEWTLHSNNVVPQQQLVQLADLVPGSWYTLLMSAHNDAGSTEVELSFATLTLTGELPSRSYELLDPQVAFYRHLTVTVPIVSAIVVLVIVVGVVCVVLRRRNYDPRQRIGMVVAECCDASKGDLMLAVSHESQAREPVYYPAPYATHNRGGAATGAGTGQCNNMAGNRDAGGAEDPKNRTYDVPYPVKRGRLQKIDKFTLRRDRHGRERHEF